MLISKARKGFWILKRPEKDSLPDEFDLFDQDVDDQDLGDADWDAENFYREVLMPASMLRKLDGRVDMVYLLEGLDYEELAAIAASVTGEDDEVDPEDLPGLAHKLVAAAGVRISHLDSLAYNLLSRTVRSEGVLAEESSDEETLELLRHLGLLFSGILEAQGLVLVVPAEIMQRYGEQILSAEARQSAERNDRILSACLSVLDYYGVLSIKGLLEKLESVGCKVTAEQLDQLSWVAQAHGYMYYIDVDVVRHPGADEFEWILAEQKARPKLPYAKLPADLLAENPAGLTKRPAYAAFAEHLLRNGTADDDVTLMLETVDGGFKNGQNPVGVLEELTLFICGDPEDEEEDEEDNAVLAGAYAFLDRMLDETPVWYLKGHTPAAAERRGVEVEPLVDRDMFDDDEFFGDEYPLDEPLDDDDDDFMDLDYLLPSQEADSPPSKTSKVGRNDPCPCGSGKKYKKCCGKAE